MAKKPSHDCSPPKAGGSRTSWTCSKCGRLWYVVAGAWLRKSDYEAMRSRHAGVLDAEARVTPRDVNRLRNLLDEAVESRDAAEAAGNKFFAGFREGVLQGYVTVGLALKLLSEQDAQAYAGMAWADDPIRDRPGTSASLRLVGSAVCGRALDPSRFPPGADLVVGRLGVDNDGKFFVSCPGAEGFFYAFEVDGQSVRGLGELPLSAWTVIEDEDGDRGEEASDAND